MESKPASVEELFQKLKDYADVRLDLFKLKSINKAASFMSTSITIVILIIFFSAVLLCFTVGAALFIGELLGKTYYGFFIVGGILLLIGFLLYSIRQKFIRPRITDKLIEELID